ncbi:MAG: calcium-binding protein, partial [Sphingomicrobium sp.]
MPELFDLPGPRSGSNNFGATYVLPYGADYTVSAGSNLYASLFTMFDGDYNYPTFTNNGTLWNVSSSSNVVGVVTGTYITSVTNNGTMIADAGDGNAYTVSVGSGGQSVTNSGSMYAIANGNANVITHWDPGVVIQNDGLIAAYAPAASVDEGGVGSPVGVAMFNGGVLNNNSGGSILAEGMNAPTAIIFGRGSPFGSDVITNWGRIEALSTVAGVTSYGILAGGVASEIIKFENHGLLKADIAWSSYGDNPVYAPQEIDQLSNAAGGTIIGRIETGGGDDTLINNGSITGEIALGDDNDVFDSSGGTWSGSADLGWGDDFFMGSAGTDVVQGNRNADQLTGNGGNDLLLGGIGADTVSGGDGNDGLYGELGDDHIFTEGADLADGGDGNDLIEGGDLAFAHLSGGAGDDTLRFDVGAIKLNLHSALATGRIEGFETIELQDNQQIAISAGDATELAGGTLEINGSDGTQVALVGAWVQGAETVRDGVTYRSFSLAGDTILVESGVAAAIVAAVPPGFAGLAPVASGDAAPVAGSLPGGDLSNPVQAISDFYLDHQLVIDPGETWYASNTSVIEGHSLSEGLVNGGIIETTNTEEGYEIQAVANDVAYIVNTGTIRGTALGSSWVDAIFTRGTLENRGTIEAFSDSGRAMAAEIGNAGIKLVFENYGTISATSSTGTAVGVIVVPGNPFGDGPVGVNYGSISVSGGSDTTALWLLTGGQFVNEGNIVATNSAASGAAEAVAVLLSNNSSSSDEFINDGTVSAVVAIRSLPGYYTSAISDHIVNNGDIIGRIELGDGDDRIDNSGSIDGIVSLGDGADTYSGAAATAAAKINGDGGNDTLAAGAYDDHLNGNAGDDKLVGNAGNDVLNGGAGNDRLIGGTGDDIYYVDSYNDKVIESAGEGSDRVFSSSNYVLGDNVEVLTLTGSASTYGYGNDIDNVLTGNAASNKLFGLGGNDVIDGGAGTDRMFGGTGDDIYHVDTYNDHVIENAGEGNDSVIASDNYKLSDNI